MLEFPHQHPTTMSPTPSLPSRFSREVEVALLPDESVTTYHERILADLGQPSGAIVHEHWQRAAKCGAKLMGTEAINSEEVEKETKGKKKEKKKKVVAEFVEVFRIL